MKMIPFFCALLVAVAFILWGILSIQTDVFGPMLSGTASLAFGAGLFIYLFYDAVEQIVNANKAEKDDVDDIHDSY